MSRVKIHQRPSDFIDIRDKLPNIVERIDYATTHNFTGGIVPGYAIARGILQEDALAALAQVENELNKTDLGLIIYDAFRPHRSVEYFFNEWLQAPLNLEIQAKYFPEKTKQQLFSEGFLSRNSSHSRGSTVDLSIVSLVDKTELDMGTYFDFFHQKSYTESSEIEHKAIQNRRMLNEIMSQYGFVNYPKEWWHFRFVKEKYKHFYFDFEII